MANVARLPQQVVMPMLPCLLRGARTGERECPTCGNKKIRLAVYTCPYHPQGATYQDCRTHRLGANAHCLPLPGAMTDTISGKKE